MLMDQRELRECVTTSVLLPTPLLLLLLCLYARDPVLSCCTFSGRPSFSVSSWVCQSTRAEDSVHPWFPVPCPSLFLTFLLICAIAMRWSRGEAGVGQPSRRVNLVPTRRDQAGRQAAMSRQCNGSTQIY